jgi:hypothetical protein
MYRLGRNPSSPDERDFKLSDFIFRKLAFGVQKSRVWNFLAEPLDQGDHPWCVGFSGADFGINEPIEDLYTNETGKKFYELCKIIDGEPGQQNGSNIRSIAKVLQNEGRISNYAFAASIDEIKYWLLNNGPLIIGTDWYAGMFTPDRNNVIHRKGALAGGHAYIFNEIKDNKYFGIQNSWGEWGVKGKAYISICDFKKLFKSGGEALAAVELPI